MKTNNHDIVVVGRDFVGWWAGLVRFDEIVTDDVNDMVAQILDRLGADGRIRMLEINGHVALDGTGLTIGSTTLDETMLATTMLSQLRDRFMLGARVKLRGCRLGALGGHPFLRRFSEVLGGVSVMASTADQRAIIPGLEGGITRCSPTVCTYSGRTVYEVRDAWLDAAGGFLREYFIDGLPM